MTVETGGYAAHYSHAGAGVLALDTSVGDDKWRFGTTNFFPGISIRDGVRFGNWFPRATFSGPIKKGRAWFSEAISVQHRLTIVNGLPEGQNVATEWAGDDLLRAQVTITPRNILQGTFLFNRSSDPQNGLGPLTPLSTTTDMQSRRYFASVKDQIWIGRTLLEFGVANDTGRSTNDPQGNAPYVVTPSTSSGNYFQTSRSAVAPPATHRRYHLGPLETVGNSHALGGWNADGIDFAQQCRRELPIDFVRTDGTLSDLATFSGPAAFRLSNTQIGGYVARPMAASETSSCFRWGFVSDRDRLIQQTLVQPRLAVNWVPKEDGRMKFTVAWGEHYQPINLTILGQGSDQSAATLFTTVPD